MVVILLRAVVLNRVGVLVGIIFSIGKAVVTSWAGQTGQTALSQSIGRCYLKFVTPMLISVCSPRCTCAYS